MSIADIQCSDSQSIGAIIGYSLRWLVPYTTIYQVLLQQDIIITSSKKIKIIMLHRGENHSMVEHTSYYARNNSVITKFAKYYWSLTTLRHFQWIFQLLTCDTTLVRPYSVKSVRVITLGNSHSNNKKEL